MPHLSITGHQTGGDSPQYNKLTRFIIHTVPLEDLRPAGWFYCEICSCAQHSNNGSDLFLLNRLTSIKSKAFVMKIIFTDSSRSDKDSE